ncbi:MAG: dockerin type I repeat-containing protein, partial [Oscillospiraceae bacterium]|nr:dockerin type I repeat-containing protein [Oscillospiraceae bacterium]
STTEETTTTTEETTEPVQTKNWGDVDSNGNVNASDAARILVYAAHAGAGTLYEISWEEQDKIRNLADLNQDNVVNSKDAAIVLQYAAEYGSGAFNGTLEAYLKEKETDTGDTTKETETNPPNYAFGY